MTTQDLNPYAQQGMRKFPEISIVYQPYNVQCIFLSKANSHRLESISFRCETLPSISVSIKKSLLA